MHSYRITFCVRGYIYKNAHFQVWLQQSWKLLESLKPHTDPSEKFLTPRAYGCIDWHQAWKTN